MSDNYTVLHLHSMDSNPYSGLEVDSVTPFERYIEEAKKCGMTAIAFTEHGCILHNVAKKQLCEKNGIKYIHAEEFYITETLDKERLVRDNYHCLLYAKNKKGVEELNKLSSISMNRDDGHFYYNPRISIDELENTSDNILILTGCVAGMLSKGSQEIKERFFNFVIKNKHRCWLEIQPHTFDYQVQYNKYLYMISQKYGLKLIATNDIHAINQDHYMGRAVMQKSKKIVFHDEDECDLAWMDFSGIGDAFAKQNALPKNVYMDAIEETNNFANQIEDYKLDYSNKYPRPYKDSRKEFKDRIKKGIAERGIDKLPNYKTDYIPRIREEYKTYKKNDAIDFMLIDSDYKLWMLQNGMHYGPSRGSVSGSIIAYLIHCTDVDSVKYDLNFSRFMNPDRASLADVDTDIYADDRYKVREYFFNRTDMSCCNIVTFNTIQMRGAIKDVGRAFEMDLDEVQRISDSVYTDDNGKDAVPDEVRKKYPELFGYVDIVIGTITSLGRHAAGIVISPIDVESAFGTLSLSSDPRPVSQIDMHEIDSLNFVKLDLLGLNAIGLINKACDLIGIDFITSDNIDFSDENVIKSMSEDTTLIFQFESGFASEALKKTLSEKTIANMKTKNENISYLDIMAMVNGAIRPAGESYRDALFQGLYHDNGNEELNKFLASTLGYLVYQCQIIDFLHDFCGFEMGQADIVRRHFAKKTGTEQDIPIIKNGGYMVDVHGNKDKRYIKGYIAIAQEKYGMTKEEAENSIEYFLNVIEDASRYLFSRNHAIPYSMIGFYIAWLKYYYPLQLFTAALNVYKDNEAKMNEIKNCIKQRGIKMNGIKFGKSRADYFMDVNTNSIYQGIESIKNCNAKSAEELYALSKTNSYESFIDLLCDIKNKTSLDCTKLDILIKLNYFSDFGEPKKLLRQVEIFNRFYGRKQFKFDQLDKLYVKNELVKKYAGKTTDKMYTQVDVLGLMKEICETIWYEETTLKDHFKYELEYLGYITSFDPSADKKLYCVIDVIIRKTLIIIKLYEINSGKTREVKMWSKQYAMNPICKNQMINIYKIDKKNKREPNGEINPKTGKKIYVDIPDKFEYWLVSYGVAE